jgi:hypothetical protein
MQDLLGGNVDTAWLTVAGMLAQAPGGKLKALAVSSDRRVAAVPDTPTLAETREMSGVSMGAWMGPSARSGRHRGRQGSGRAAVCGQQRVDPLVLRRVIGRR